MVAFKDHKRSSSIVHNNDAISDDDLFDDALAEAYKIMYLKSIDDCKASEKENVRI